MHRSSFLGSTELSLMGPSVLASPGETVVVVVLVLVLFDFCADGCAFRDAGAADPDATGEVIVVVMAGSGGILVTVTGSNFDVATVVVDVNEGGIGVGVVFILLVLVAMAMVVGGSDFCVVVCCVCATSGGANLMEPVCRLLGTDDPDGNTGLVLVAGYRSL